VKEDIAYIAGPVRYQVWDRWPTDNDSVTEVLYLEITASCYGQFYQYVCASLNQAFLC